MDYNKAENYHLAIKLCDSLIEVDSTFHYAYFEKGMTHIRLNEDSLALGDFEKLEAIDPNYPGLKTWHAITLHVTGRHLEAATLMHVALRANPNGFFGQGVSPGDWAECAGYFHDAGLSDSAIYVLDEYFNGYVQHVTEFKYLETTPLRTYATLLMEKKDFKKAFDKMKAAMESQNVDPSDYEPWIEVNILNGNYREAQELLDNYVRDFHREGETEGVKRLRMMMEAARGKRKS